MPLFDEIDAQNEMCPTGSKYLQKENVDITSMQYESTKYLVWKRSA